MGVNEPPPLAGGAWSSSLSVAEHAAVREAGFTPRGLVMGSSVYQLAPSYSPAATWGGAGGSGAWGGSWRGSWPGWVKYYSWADLGASRGYSGGAGMGAGGLAGAGWGPVAAAVCWERVSYERGVEEAARLALERLEAETAALGAHGVIGIRLRFRYLEGMASTLEFTALGTAVVRAGAERLPRPFTSHLDGQSLLKLLGSGMVPVAAAVGVGSVSAEFPRWGVGGASMELRPFGDALEMSRRLAADRLAAAAGARGWAVLGTLASVSSYGEGEAEVSNTVLTGTVVRRFAPGGPSRLPLAVMRLSRT